MIIIIDGYNLLKQLIGSVYITDARRSGFIALCGRYVQKRNHEIFIVFDGGEYTKTYTEKSHGVIIMYSGLYLSADEVIIQLIKSFNQKQIVVVTFDRELIRIVSSCLVSTIDPLLFYEKMKFAVYHKIDNNYTIDNNIIKLSQDSTKELDNLMYEYVDNAQIIEIKNKKNNDNILREIVPQNRISKKIKILNKLLDKL